MTQLNPQELNKIREIRIHSILGIRDDGRRIMIRCPFHKDRTASFVLYIDNSFNCFGCGKNGQNAIDFTMALDYSFEDACLELMKYLK